MDGKRKLRNYLLNARFQLPITLVVVGIAVGLTTGLGYVWYRQARETSEVIEARSLGAPASAAECRKLCDLPNAALTDEQLQRIRRDLKTADQQRLWVLIGFGIAFSLLLAIYGIVSTHKVAGPLFKIGRHMSDISKGRLYPLYGIRKGDSLQEFWEIFREMHDVLRQRGMADCEVLQGALLALEQAGPEVENLRAQVRELLAQKTAQLGPRE